MQNNFHFYGQHETTYLRLEMTNGWWQMRRSHSHVVTIAVCLLPETRVLIFLFKKKIHAKCSALACVAGAWETYGATVLGNARGARSSREEPLVFPNTYITQAPAAHASSASLSTKGNRLELIYHVLPLLGKPYTAQTERKIINSD